MLYLQARDVQKHEKGEIEPIASTTVQLALYARQLPSNALRHSVLTTISAEIRLSDSVIMKPYTTGTILPGQVIPLISSNNSLHYNA